MPKTAEISEALCIGNKRTGKPLHYKVGTFHRIIPKFIIEGGGGESIFDQHFTDENFDLKHSERFDYLVVYSCSIFCFSLSL